MKDWQASAAALHDGGLRRMLIDGQWCAARSGEVIEARNPAAAHEAMRKHLASVSARLFGET